MRTQVKIIKTTSATEFRLRKWFAERFQKGVVFKHLDLEFLAIGDGETATIRGFAHSENAWSSRQSLSLRTALIRFRDQGKIGASYDIIRLDLPLDTQRPPKGSRLVFRERRPESDGCESQPVQS